MYPHDKFQNNPVIFDRPPKPPFFIKKKTYFTNNFYLRQGTPMPNFRFLNPILVDLVRPSFFRKYVHTYFLKIPFWDPFQNWKPYPNVCGERSWLPISKMV